jgi:hypothetical protein
MTLSIDTKSTTSTVSDKQEDWYGQHQWQCGYERGWDAAMEHKREEFEKTEPVVATLRRQFTDRELLQIAFDELEELAEVGYGSLTVLEALRDRLSQPVPKPVAWMCEASVFGSGGWKRTVAFERNDNECFRNWKPLYAEPQSCTEIRKNCGDFHTEWVGLTVEEIDDIWKTEVFDVHYGIARMVEAKLKEKNT